MKRWSWKAVSASEVIPEAEAPPLRAELFSLDQLRRHTQHLAERHTVVAGRAEEQLLPRLTANEQALTAAYDLVLAALDDGRRVSPAAEWLLDNFYLIGQQIQITRRHLPPHYSRQLPRLAGGTPRVHDMALELIMHVDGRVDAENATAFVDAYQRVTPLNLGELWAFPIMLRLALIENLRRVADRIARARVRRDLALEWADRMLAAAEHEPRQLIQLLADMDRQHLPLTKAAFVEEFFAKLQGRGPSVAFVLSWVEHQLIDRGTTFEQLVRADSQSQAADQVSIANSIGSLRTLNAMDWREFVETLSRTDRILRNDPADVYSDQDFATRDRYRHVVEELAKRSPLDERAVAEQAVALAQAVAGRDGKQAREAHVGYFLVDAGRPALEQAVRFEPRWTERPGRWGRRHPLFSYLAPTAALAALLTALVWPVALTAQAPGWVTGVLLAAAALGASSLAVALVNLAVTMLVRPRTLPRLDFRSGIPPDHRTMVVIPTLLGSSGDVAPLIEGLEIRYLGNRDPNLFFALLTDFADAPAETLPDDEALLALAQAGIAALNARYGGDQGGPFYLFHRPRIWNPHEQCWMGWERKRGKLEQFNELLRGGSAAPFMALVGAREVLPSIKYVLTLDTDTQLPRDAARKLVGTMAHPLNTPVFDPGRGRVVAGYTILQPRTAISLPSATRSPFARLFSGEAGIDPYTREVSDVYQDVFGEGSYVGKGLYHVDAFRAALAGRFPENLILSHDLLESCHARSALVTDIELFEDHPSRYVVEASRQHRWIRGDWQIAGWLRSRVSGPAGARRPNPLAALGRWKILDNLRRSLVPPALLTLLGAGWLAAPAAARFWLTYVAAILVAPTALSVLLDLLRKPGDRPWRAHLGILRHACVCQLAQAALALILLPYDAMIRLDAIWRSGVRMGFTRRGLLLWHTADYARRNARTSLAAYAAEMWVAPALAVTLGIALAWTQPIACAYVLPILLLWLVAPGVGWWISRAEPPAAPAFSAEQQVFLRVLSRRTWRYFEAFAAEPDHWLPPDNFQEHPAPVIASRTSPTNLGLGLLSVLAAHDFGYVSTPALLERLGRMMDSMEKLERFRGHFYNWYDTRTLKPLPPMYVSSVDSGNLAASLLTLRVGLLDLKSAPVFSARMPAGLDDTLLALIDAAPDAPAAVGAIVTALRATLMQPPASVPAAVTALRALVRDGDRLVAALANPPDSPAHEWARAFDRQCREALDDLEGFASADAGETPTLADLAKAADPAARERAMAQVRTIEALAQRCDEWLSAMDFSFLYDRSRDLLAIGYHVADRRRDLAFYDLLASEARLASFLLIAQGQLPQEHWFALSRLLTTYEGTTALISWSGSMFEYLMPMLWLPSYENTLLDATCRAVVARQMQYGRQRGVPWGVSESCYHAVDIHQTYQYSAFGVPGLGLKRGLGDDLVIAPYASALALMVRPREACANLQRLADSGFLGDYGMIEAIDYTPARVPAGKTAMRVRAYMAHHQGMSLLALAHVLRDRPMQRRFMSDPFVRATELLLQERIPKSVATLYPHAAEVTSAARPPAETAGPSLRVFTHPHSPVPEVHLLSNGRYHVMVTHAGGGYSRWKEIALTRWREDATADPWGLFLYLRDLDSDRVWSVAHQPTGRRAERYEAIFMQARAEYRRRDEQLDVHTEISVSPEDDVEIRRVTLTNLSRRPRRLEVTSYAEVVLAPLNADLAHRAFSNLFVQTEIDRDRQAIFATRRPRGVGEQPPWLVHVLVAPAAAGREPSYETDRARFIGRGRTTAQPAALTQPLSGSAGSVLDPIVAIRRVITIPPEESVTLHLALGAADTRDAAVALAERYRDPSLADRVFEMAWSHSQVMLQHLNATEADAQTYNRLAGAVLYANRLYRAHAGVVARNRFGQTQLWQYGISGDWPIVLVRIADVNRLDLIKHVVQAHAYWRVKGLDVDLVIMNEDFSGYRQELQDRILGLIGAGSSAPLLDQPRGIFVRRSEQLAEPDRLLFQAVARVVLSDTAETLAEQVERRWPVERLPAAFSPTRGAPDEPPAPPMFRALLFYNGVGGFTSDGREYVVQLAPGQTTPAPWVNVLANPAIGTVVSESGSAYTWAENAHEFRLTTWQNDPVTDATGEAFYVRDEETGRYWSPTPLPARGDGHYVTRHGFGYSVFEHDQDGIRSELWTYVAADEPLKFVVLKLQNHTDRPRRLSATGYWELALGEWRHANLMHIVTETDPHTGAVLARNAYRREFAKRVVLAAVSASTRTVTGNRMEFLGRNGTLARPAAMGRTGLSGQTGAGLDPCAAVQTIIDLPPGAEKEIVFLFGAGHSVEDAQRLVRQYAGPAAARVALEAVWQQWNRLLGTVYVETPDPAVNILVNGWLEYQTIACRFWGRSGYYQSGGAYGFRDQLQDTSTLVLTEPWLAREQLLRCASRQFREGDVQHWWHPPAGRGVRTKFSDDYLWLPWALCRYVRATGDVGVLEERVPFLDGRPVNADEEAYYDLHTPTAETATVYDHAVRAVRHGLRFGAHGLPLIGCGDWNDGMNQIGTEGRGESVWLAWFLADVLRQFAALAEHRGDAAFSEHCRTEIATLVAHIEEHAWDGAWYRRAYFDDGTPLGSAGNDECQLDSISQSWAVLSAAGDPVRARGGLAAVHDRLVDRDAALIRLLDPPFDAGTLNPGYIKGYPPGVRENGGQYTHAAIWTVMATALLGDHAQAWDLFRLIQPIRHASTPEAIEQYRVEPYVMAADVYSQPPHAGRGGWTWYTGSAGWMFLLAVETLLGIEIEVDRLKVTPRLPPEWDGYTMHYRYRETFYHIEIQRRVPGAAQVGEVIADGIPQPDHRIPLVDDRGAHHATVWLDDV
jgi:cyclic beta-1,2-glucan synthetase